MPGLHFCTADLLLSLLSLCADEATSVSGAGQLLRGQWVSAPSLLAPCSAAALRRDSATPRFSNRAGLVPVKQRCAGNRSQSRGPSACVRSAAAPGSISCWAVTRCLGQGTRRGRCPLVLLALCQRPCHHSGTALLLIFTCHHSQPDVLLREGVCKLVALPCALGSGEPLQLPRHPGRGQTAQ